MCPTNRPCSTCAPAVAASDKPATSKLVSLVQAVFDLCTMQAASRDSAPPFEAPLKRGERYYLWKKVVKQLSSSSKICGPQKTRTFDPAFSSRLDATRLTN